MKHAEAKPAELIVAGRVRIDDAAADIQMGLRIAVVEDVAVLR